MCTPRRCARAEASARAPGVARRTPTTTGSRRTSRTTTNASPPGPVPRAGVGWPTWPGPWAMRSAEGPRPRPAAGAVAAAEPGGSSGGRAEAVPGGRPGHSARAPGLTYAASLTCDGCVHAGARLALPVWSILAAQGREHTYPAEATLPERSRLRPRPLIERHRRRGGHIERIRSGGHRDRSAHVTGPHGVFGQPRPLRTQHKSHLLGVDSPRQRGVRRGGQRDGAEPALAEIAEGTLPRGGRFRQVGERQPQHMTHRDPHDPAVQGIAGGRTEEHTVLPERSAVAEDRAQVLRVVDPLEHDQCPGIGDD